MAKPKLCLIPAAQGSKLFSVLPSSGVGDFNFTRSGSATRINSQGLIEEVSNGVSRLNYPMIDGKVVGCPHHILEPARTNLITYSQDFSDASWIKSNVSITSNSILSPDGTTNASLMTISGGASDQRIYKNISYSGTNTVSVFAKASDSNWISIRIGSSVNKWYDLENGVLGGSTIISSYVDADIQDYGNGWYRCILVFTDNFNTSTRIYPAENNLDVTHTSGSVYIWGAQAEANASYITSYIPTDGSAVTRSAETANGSGNASTFNDSEGVLMAEISALANDGTFRVISINGTATNVNTNRIQIYFRDTADIITFGMESENLSQFFLQFPLDVKSNNKLALKYSASSCSFWINGIKVGEETNKVMPTDLIRLDFVRQDGNDEFFYGNTKQIQYYNSALTDSELETLTSWTSFTDMAEGQLYSIE